MGCRKISQVLQVMKTVLNISPPHHTTIRQWILRIGCYHIQKPLKIANDWIVIADITVDIGKMKCLAIVGVRKSEIINRENYTLQHKDVEFLGLCLTPSPKSEIIENAFLKARDRIGKFEGINIDQGSDIKKGAKLFQEKFKTKIIHDIPHKLCLVMEQEFKNDPCWGSYMKELANTRNLLLQTELAGLMPPTPRLKARFMSISKFINWPQKILNNIKKGDLKFIEEDRYQRYFGWLDSSKFPLENWGFIADICEKIKEITREHGISRDVLLYLREFFKDAPITSIRVKKFIEKAINAVKEEVDKLNWNQTMLCSTEVLESIFGKYKAIYDGVHGITGSVLGMATLTRSEQTDQEVKAIMERTSVKDLNMWFESNVGNTIGKLQKKFFRRNGQNLKTSLTC